MVLALAKGLFYSSPTQRAGMQQRLSAALDFFLKKPRIKSQKIRDWLV